MDNYFDEVANEWDTPTRKERAKELAQALLTKLGTVKALTALEIGCGTGLLSMCMAKDWKEISCMDTAEKMRSVLDEKIKKSNTNNVKVIGEELEVLMQSGVQYDVIFSSMVFHHIMNLELELQMIRHLLKSGGRVAVIDLDEDGGRFHENEKDFNGHNGFNRTAFEKMLSRNGFYNIEMETVHTGKKDLGLESIDYSLFLCIAVKK